MRNLHQARQIAAEYLAQCSSGSVELVLVDEHTKEYAEGWVFYYDNAQHLRTKDIQDAIAGNAPVFVPRAEVAPSVISYHRSIADSLEAYRRTGNSNAQHIPCVILPASSNGASVALAIKAIRRNTNLGLGEAKLAARRCVDGKQVSIPVASIEVAQGLALELHLADIQAYVAYDA